MIKQLTAEAGRRGERRRVAIMMPSLQLPASPPPALFIE